MQLFHVRNIKGGRTQFKCVVILQLNQSVSQHPLPTSDATQVAHLHSALNTVHWC